jgi:ATP-dependent DNA helicase RecQ
LKKSFARKNIAYGFEVEDKLFRQNSKENPQSSIIYVRNRKSCIEISSQLQSLGFKATYYHGLTSREKDKNMQLWMEDKGPSYCYHKCIWDGLTKQTLKP